MVANEKGWQKKLLKDKATLERHLVVFPNGNPSATGAQNLQAYARS